MTYEEKLLEVFARFRGAGTDPETIEHLERACNAEIWRHLPHDVRSSWRLKLAFSPTHPGQVELEPRRLREDGATSAELEAALRSPFREEEPIGGFAGVSVGFGGGRMPEQKPAAPLVGDQSEAISTVRSDADSIEAQATALGISLPRNSSLLGPFLEALAAATEYRARAEAAEGELAKIRAALSR